MPVLSRFYGIIIRMYFQQSEHNPPHIHAIELVMTWIEIHNEELLEIWNTQNFKVIKPLE